MRCCSQQPKAKAFRKYCCNELFPRVRKLLVDKMIDEKQKAIDEKDMQIALLDDDLTESQDLVRQLEFNNTGLQGEIRAKDQQIAHLEQRYVHLLAEEKKNYGMTIVAKNDESEYPYISICGQHGYRKQKKRVVLLKNPGSTEFTDRDTPNAIVTYNLWREHKLIETNPQKPRDFKLVNMEENQLQEFRYKNRRYFCESCSTYKISFDILPQRRGFAMLHRVHKRCRRLLEPS